MCVCVSAYIGIHVLCVNMYVCLHEWGTVLCTNRYVHGLCISGYVCLITLLLNRKFSPIECLIQLTSLQRMTVRNSFPNTSVHSQVVRVD